MHGHVASIVYSPQRGSFIRKPLSEAVLVAGFGIHGDRKGGHPGRNLNIMDRETLDLLAAEGVATAPGVLGENLILGGVCLDRRPPGTLIQIGDRAVVELVALREPCYKLTAVHAAMPESVIGRVGVMAAVIEGGRISVGDPVIVLSQQ